MSDVALDKDKAEIAALIRDCYAMVSGPAGPRDWSRQDELFHPDCRQMRTGVDANGAPWIETFSPDEYAANADALLSTMDFYEVALVNRIEVFGNMAQAWSSYEAKHHPDDTEPERRGINAFQFYKGPEGRWQIISMIWDNERAGLTLPEAMTQA
jgi:hypothetical protein